MNNEKKLELVYTMVKEYDNATGGGLYEKVIKEPHNFLDCNVFPFYKTAAELIIEAREAMDKKAGRGNIAAAKRVIKTAGDNRRDLAGIWKEADGKNVMCDGYRIIRLAEDIPSLPHLERGPVDTKKFMNQVNPAEYVEIELPSMAAINAAIANEKAMRSSKYDKIPYELTLNVFVNPSFLRDMMELLPGARCYCKSSKSPLVFRDDEGNEGILLPVNGNAVKRTCNAA